MRACGSAGVMWQQRVQQVGMPTWACDVCLAGQQGRHSPGTMAASRQVEAVLAAGEKGAAVARRLMMQIRACHQLCTQRLTSCSPVSGCGQSLLSLCWQLPAMAWLAMLQQLRLLLLLRALLMSMLPLLLEPLLVQQAVLQTCSSNKLCVS